MYYVYVYMCVAPAVAVQSRGCKTPIKCIWLYVAYCTRKEFGALEPSRKQITFHLVIEVGVGECSCLGCLQLINKSKFTTKMKKAYIHGLLMHFMDVADELSCF